MKKTLDFDYENCSIDYPSIFFDKKNKPRLFDLVYCLEFDVVDKIFVYYKFCKISFDDYNSFLNFIEMNLFLKVDFVVYDSSSITIYC